MVNKRPLSLVCVVLLAALSAANLFGISLSWIVFLAGIAFYFLFKQLDKAALTDYGLDIRQAAVYLGQGKMWISLLAPILVNLGLLLLSRLVFPAYWELMSEKNAALLLSDGVILFALQIILVAFGEELAWRGVFQKQLCPISPALALTASALFYSLGHLSSASPAVMAYDFAIIFLCNLFYGYIYKKSESLWLASFSHMAANLSVILLLSLAG